METNASKEIAAFVEGSGYFMEFKHESTATAWLRRVKKWTEQTCDAIRPDAIPAPGRPHERWLLYDASGVVTNASTGRINCHQCKKCRASLSGVTGKNKYVINLGRNYVSVKRVFLNRARYARTDASEAPLFHQKNVVAYPQNPDARLRALRLSLANLAHTLHVHFVCGDLSFLRLHAEMQVSVENSRSAILWFTKNSWPFMVATKQHDAWKTCCLETNLVEQLRQNATSIGNLNGGVSADILQGISDIAHDFSKVALFGPADCVAADEDEGHKIAKAASFSGPLPDMTDKPDDNEN